MKTLNCLIVDDEPLAREQIKSFVERIPYLKLMGVARNVEIANNLLKTDAIDLIFLDIKMPKITGIEFLRSNDIFQQVIIISAFPDYALEGYELEVTDYLMKPVPFERFLKACEKAFARINGSANLASINGKPDFLYVRCNQRFEKININDILFMESMLNYVIIVVKDKQLVVHSSLKAMEEALPKNEFIKIHKSFIVAANHIRMIENHKIHIGDHLLPVSRAKWPFIVQHIKNLSRNDRSN